MPLSFRMCSIHILFSLHNSIILTGDGREARLSDSLSGILLQKLKIKIVSTFFCGFAVLILLLPVHLSSF